MEQLMKVTVKGQVTIPRHIRKNLGLHSHSEVDFIEEDGRIILVKKNKSAVATSRFRACRGSAETKLTTDEIMALTRSQS